MGLLVNRRRTYGGVNLLNKIFTLTNTDEKPGLYLEIGSYVPTTALKSISISRDGGQTWATYNNKNNQAINIPIFPRTSSLGDLVMIKGIGTSLAASTGNTNDLYYTTFNKGTTNTKLRSFKASGNIMSLLYGDNFKGKTTFSGTYNFACLFNHCTISGKIILPATTLTSYCYKKMFYYSSANVEIKATTINNYSCEGMFIFSSSPKVVFNGPLIVNTGGMRSMFSMSSIQNASNIQIVSCGEQGCLGMFNNCTRLSIAPTLSATTLSSECYRQMFYNCSALLTAPTLPALNLVEKCYYEMFYNCHILSYIKAMFKTLPSGCTASWVQGVKASGTFVKNNTATWTNNFSTSAIPSGWTVQTASS